MHDYYTFLVLELANRRALEADRDRLAALARSGAAPSDGRTRRGAARVLAAISRGSAALVRRLDDCVADDLAESFGAERLAPSR